MSLIPIAGERFYIGGVVADKATDFVASDFAGETWVEVDGWVTMGALGDSAEVISTLLINRNRVIKQKGPADAGSMQNQFARIPDDAGQDALIAAGAAANKNNYAFKITGNETVGFDSPSERLFIGLVMGTPEPGGAGNVIRMLDATVEINGNPVIVDAVPTP